MVTERRTSISEVSITGQDPNVTVSDGTADQLSTVIEFTVPDRTLFVIRPGDIAAFTFKSSTPTEIADTGLVKIIHSDANGITSEVIAESIYLRFKEFQDRAKLFSFGKKTVLQPDEKLQVQVNANLAIDADETVFVISAERGAQTI